MIIARYILEIASEAAVVDASEAAEWDRRDLRVMADLPVYMEEVVENLTDILPEGYHAQIGDRERRD